jgi:hypothetical protein
MGLVFLDHHGIDIKGFLTRAKGCGPSGLSSSSALP